MSRVLTRPVSGVLLGDQGDRNIPFSDKIYLLQDMNGDGDAADEGERLAFFDETNAAGLGGETPTDDIFDIFQASDSFVYAGDGNTDSVYRLRDYNGDGDANDVSEATVWFSATENASGLLLQTPNGITEGADGAIYISNAGAGAQNGIDNVFRTIDLNGDGDANDEGESSLFLDLGALVGFSVPFDMTAIGDRFYLADFVGGAEGVIYTFRDDDSSGAIEADELSVFADQEATGARLDFALDADGDSIVTWELSDSDTGVQSIFRLTDLDNSGAIDQENETEEIWNTSTLPGVFVRGAGFSIAADGEGRIAITSNDLRNASGDTVYILEDLNQDGDYFDVGETNILATRGFDPDTLQRPRAVEFYEDDITVGTKLAGGNQFSLFLDEESDTVFAAGANFFGQLGQGIEGFSVAAPLPVEVPEDFDEDIVSVSAGQLHGSFLTVSGDVYVWGFGLRGRLGLGDEENQTVATKISGDLDDERVTIIDHGNGVSFAITDDGTLFGWGQNNIGQLGLGDEENRLVPTVIDVDGKKIIAVSSGNSHTLALASDGSVYGFGGNRDGQAAPDQLEAPGDPVNEVLNPTLINGLPSNIVAITADTQTSYAVTEDGRVFGWGENSFGQLLVGTDQGDGTFIPTDDSVLTPVELDVPGNVVDIKGGARWVAALTDEGEVYFWGPNDEGVSGGLDGDPLAESDVSFFPTTLPELARETIVEIQSGPQHFLALADDGTIFTFGENGDGRLGYLTDGRTYVPDTVDLDGDAAPFLLFADPADNARDVARDSLVVLNFTEEVFRGTGEIRFVNRDNPDESFSVDVANPFLVGIEGGQVTVTPSDFFARDARYAVEIDEGAFEDATGNPFPGIETGDTSTFNFTAADTEVENVAIFGKSTGDLHRGTPENDVIFARAGDDFVLGLDGNDTIAGENGDDTIFGGGGNDSIRGDSNDDVLFGEDGNDRIRGGNGGDTVSGGEGDDTLSGEGSSDSLSGDAGNDRLIGGERNDTLLGGDDDDRLIGGLGLDSLLGGEGNDTLNGNEANDFLGGEGGNDRLIGGDKKDTLVGGDGDDIKSGNSGIDLFVFDSDDGRDIITDFESGTDTIQLTDDTPFTIAFNANTGNSVLRYGDTIVVVRGVDLQDSSVEYALTATTAGDLLV
ncbi:MAG: Ig-like domain-containing protein [Pseudomonadota bacterium]